MKSFAKVSCATLIESLMFMRSSHCHYDNHFSIYNIYIQKYFPDGTLENYLGSRSKIHSLLLYLMINTIHVDFHNLQSQHTKIRVNHILFANQSWMRKNRITIKPLNFKQSSAWAKNIVFTQILVCWDIRLWRLTIRHERCWSLNKWRVSFCQPP